MGRGRRACKYLGIIFIFSLLVQGSCAAESTDTRNDTINNTQTFPWILLLPLFLGSLLFLCWMCRFFDRMNFCFVIFILVALLLWLQSPFDLISGIARLILIGLILVFIFGVILYEILKQRKGDESNTRGQSDTIDKSNLIMGLHDILRNFIIIFAVLIWPIVLLYFDQNRISYVTFYGIDNFKFPVYIIAASYIGVLSYLFLSIEETFGHLIPEYEKMSITWSYLRRIFIAPFIAITGFYLLNDLQNRAIFSEISDYFVFVFSFFAGVFTKTIEDWIYLWVQKLLPGAKKEEFSARTKYEVKESDFVKKLGCDEDLAYMLYNAKIRKIEELASFNGKEDELMRKVNLDTRNLGEGIGCLLKNRAKTLGNYTKEQIQLYICRAKYYADMDKKSDLVKDLNMDRDLAFKLCLRAGIKTLDDLIKCDPKEVYEKICDCKKEAEELAKRKNIDIKEAYKELCEYSEEEIKNFKEKAEKLAKEKAEAKKGGRYLESVNTAENNTESKTLENHSDKVNEDPKEGQ